MTAVQADIIIHSSAFEYESVVSLCKHWCRVFLCLHVSVNDLCLVILVLGKLSATLAAGPPCGFHFAQWNVVPASVRELPAIYLLIQTHSVLSVRAEPDTARRNSARTDAFWSSLASQSLCNPVSLFSHLLPVWYKELSLITLFAVCWSHLLHCQNWHNSAICCLPAIHTLSLTNMHTLTLSDTHIDTITIVPVSCLCCHYAAAEWDMVQFPSVKDNTHKCTHVHICTFPHNIFQLSLSFCFLFCLCLLKTQTHNCALTHKHCCQNSLA